MEEVPYEINDTFAAGWWKPLCVSGSDLYVCYTSPASTGKHYTNVAKKSGGTWSTYRLQVNGVDIEHIDDYGHNQTSMAVDGSGRIHVFTSFHVSHWETRYFRSDTAGDITSITEHSVDMPNQSTKYGFTYPIVTKASNGDLYLIIRRRERDVPGQPLLMYHWDNTLGTWGIVGKVADVSDPTFSTVLYPDDLVCTSDGLVHLAFSWHKDEPSPRRHRGSYLSYNPSTGEFKTADGVSKTIPVSWTANNLVYQPLTSTETTYGDESLIGLQTAKIAIYDNKPHIVYRYRETNGGPNKVKRARWSNGWSLETIYSPSSGWDSLPSLGIYHNGGAHVYYVKTNGTDCDLFEAVKTATDPWTHTQLSTTQIERIQLDSGLLYCVNPPSGDQYILTI